MGLRKVFYLFLILFSTIFFSCHFVESLSDDSSPDNTTLTFDKDNISIKTGGMDTITLTVSENQNSAEIVWEYDQNIIKAVCDNYGAVITGLTAGSTTIKAVYPNGSTASCLVSVSGEVYTQDISNPYVYASRDFVSLVPSERVRISGALFGGTPSDSSGFSWSIDSPSVASLSTEGNSCWITGLACGTAKITMRHSKAAYPFSVLVDVSDDVSSVPYITTSNNIVSIDLDSNINSTINVSLMNDPDADINRFTYSILDSQYNDLGNTGAAVIKETIGNICNLEGKLEGECILRVSHPSAKYPLDILIHTSRHSDNSYIQLTDTLLRLSGNQKGEIKALIANSKEETDPSLFRWTFDSTASLYAQWTILNGNGADSGDTIEFNAVHTGNFKATVSYPGMTDRNVVVLVRDIADEAAKATTYITTDQSFISMNPGEEVQVNVLLKDCSVGDINDLLWSVVNTAEDGSSQPVIEWINGNGKSTSRSSRSAGNLSYSENAWCRIKALRNGKATIEVSHYKAIYSTKIDIIVKSPVEPEEKKAFITYDSLPIQKIRNTEDMELKVKISGNGTEDELIWETDSSTDSSNSITISPNGSSCIVHAPFDIESPASTNVVTVSHPKAEKILSFKVYTFGTEEEYNAIPKDKYFYISSDVEHYIKTGQNAILSVTTENDCEDHISWQFEPSNILDVEHDRGSSLTVSAIAAGKAVVTVSREGFENLYFIVNVSDSNIINESEPVYLSTNNNVVYFDSQESAPQNISVSLHNASDTHNIAWTCRDPSLFSVSFSGNTASVTPLVPNSTSVITVTHPLSQNSIEINLRCGELYTYVEPDLCIIEPSENVLNLISGSKEQMLTATIVHTAGSPTNNDEQFFTFASSDSSIVDVRYVLGTNTCFVRPVKEGKAVITINNSNAEYPCEVPVIISKPENFVNTPYLTTNSNIITLVEGDMEPVTVSIVNSPDSTSFNSYKWKWKNLDGTDFAQAVAQNGMTAMLKANSPGIQKIEIEHDDCPFPLTIVVNVLSESTVKAKPYIKVDKNIVTLSKGESVTLSAQMLGGISAASDNPFFTWTISDSTYALISPSENTCYVRALETGLTKITVRNSKYSSSYTRDILIIVEDTAKDGIYIKSSVNTLRLHPNDKSLNYINCELVNGEATDAADFIWWADDYSLISTTTISEQCSVIPIGQSGSTYIHCKHPKAKNVLDILVLVSEFENFAFSTDSMILHAGKIYFVPLQVPVQDSDYIIEYDSSDNDICCVAGSKKTAFLAARHAGSVNVTATMKTSGGSVIAQAQILLNVVEDDIRIPDISIGNSCIYEMNEGDDITLNGFITGGDVSPGEKYNLHWEIVGNRNGLSFVNGNADGTFIGADCIISALKVHNTEEFVIRISHPGTGAETYIYIVVTEKGILSIKLSTYFEQVYKSDGTFKITATVENGSANDAKNIVWSTVRQDGVQIVSVSKTKGAVCTVTPKNEGMTLVRASLPGAETKNCQVVVMQDATIKLATSNVHVMPGEKVYVDYYTEPAKCAISWVEEMNNNNASIGVQGDNYFSFQINEAEKKLEITGLKAYNSGIAGTIKGFMTSDKCSSKPVLNVFVNYDTTMKVTKNGNYLAQIVNDPPKGDTKLHPYTFDITCSPSKLSINVTSTDNNVVKVGKQDEHIVPNSSGQDEKHATVTLIPLKEGTADISINATLDGVPGVGEQRTLHYSCYYSDYTFKVVSDTAAGAFSYVDQGGSFHINDGEEIRFYIEVQNEGFAGKIDNIIWNPLPYEGVEFKKSNYLVQKPRSDIKKDYFSADSKTLDVRYPTKGLISLDTYDGGVDSKTMYRFAHNFDFYKDLPNISEASDHLYNLDTCDFNRSGVVTKVTPSTYGRTIYNYIENGDIDYFMVNADMYWQVKDDYGTRTLSTTMHNGCNNGITYWEYDNSDRGSGVFYPIFAGSGVKFINADCYEEYETYCVHSGSQSVTITATDNYFSQSSGKHESQQVSRKEVLEKYTSKTILSAEARDTRPYIRLNCPGGEGYPSQKYVYPTELTSNAYYHSSSSFSLLGGSLLDGTVVDGGHRYITGWEYNDDYDKLDGNTGWYSYEDTTWDSYITPGKQKNVSTENIIKYPSLSECNNIGVETVNGETGYLYVDYVTLSKPYVVPRWYIWNNPNYVTTPGKHKTSNASTGGDSWHSGHYSDSQYWFYPTLMHEYIVPCLCPDPNPVDNYNDRYIGQILVQASMAAGGASPYNQTINVYYTRRNCQAYQSTDWQNCGTYWVRN